MNSIMESIQSNRVWFCLDCGKCSSVCPITRHMIEGYSSPRLLVETAIGNGEEMILEDPLLWSCLTCKRCSEICPSVVHFSEFIQDVRELARGQNRSGECTHSGMMQTWSRMMVNPEIQQNRLGWIEEDLRVSKESDTLYFVGCLPYYDVAFEKLNIEGISIANAALKILNHLGIEPVVLEDERCCGHDQFWQGDMDTFRGLAVANLGKIKDTKAKRIITTCPECAWTLKHTYPDTVGDSGMDVLHLTELLAESDLEGIIPENQDSSIQKVTYQDPCRLGRYSGVYDAPRDLIMGLGYEIREMDHNRKASLCCGTSCWSSCGQVNKKSQVERLREAKSTGAELLITTCQKCQIHLKCAQSGPVLEEELQIDIRDLTTLIADYL